MPPPRPPYRWALLASGLVLAGYVASLAPTVTFWDAGEFIASARILGIPHPPGTPLFVLIAHVWGWLVPFGEYAFRLNLLSALFSAAGAGFLFLIVQETLAHGAEASTVGETRFLRIGGALAATLIAGFTFTQWQNSNETEVYAVATFAITAIGWLCLVWRSRRGTPGAAPILLLMLYLEGLSIGNHLLALLAGPAVIAFLVVTLLGAPAASAGERRAEWARTAVVAGAWALLIGTGLGSSAITVIGGACLVVAALFAAGAGEVGFAVLSLVVAAVGVTSYLYLYIRAGQHPMLNEAGPDNFQSLLAVIRRAQYPVRTPLDDPTIPHGSDNPGRTLSLFGMQLVNYVQYFDWQWANGVKGALQFSAGVLPWRSLFTLLFGWLGLRGLWWQRRADRSGWWLLFVLFLTTGLALVIYMNFKPGYSLFYDRYPTPSDHEVRERDYFFVVSYLVWGIWAGLGLTDLAQRVLRRRGGPSRLISAGLLGLAIVPFVLNFPAATRRQGPDARLAADVAYDLLNSVPPYGILFTYGDNDTFPLWWAQEVAGIRRDVTVVCLALAQTDWYMRQLRDNPIRPFDEAAAPAIWRGLNPTRPDWPTHTMTDAEIAAAQPTILQDSVPVQIGPLRHTFPPRTVLYGNDLVSIRILQQNLGRRPIAWAITTGRDFQGLDQFVVQQGLVNRLLTAAPDPRADSIVVGQLGTGAVDLRTTERLAWETYRYADLLGGSLDRLEATSAGMANTLSLPFTQLASAYDAQGDRERTLKNLEQAARLSSRRDVREALEQIRLLPRASDSAMKK